MSDFATTRLSYWVCSSVSPLGDVLAGWHDGVIEVVVSREIIGEYVRVGERVSAR